MEMNRRDMLKVSAAGAATIAVAATMTGCADKDVEAATSAAASTGAKMLGKHKVVIVGGGIGGMTVANNLKKLDKNMDILVIEKNDTFMSCPVSNTYLGKLEGMTLGTFIFDYAQPRSLQ